MLMKDFKKTLTQPIPSTPFRLWHALAGLAVLWFVPIFIPFENMKEYIYVFIVVWGIAYFLVNRLIKHTIRASKLDIILIERFFILLTFVVPAIIGTVHGIRNGFDGFTTVMVCIAWAITALLALGIVLHIKSADKYYHGVKKTDLFK